MDLAERALPLREFNSPQWYRGHKSKHDPIHFNRERGRFAAPDRMSFGTLYVGENEYCSFIEAFAHDLRRGLLGLVVSESLLRQSCLCLVSTTRTLRLVDLTTGVALKRLSPQADNRVCDGPHAVSQRWAQAIWAHPAQPDGLLYRSRNAPNHYSIALFDRAAPAIVAECKVNLLRQRERIALILDHFECGLIP